MPASRKSTRSKASPTGSRTKAQPAAPIRRRFWLTYPVHRIKDPIIWELGHRFALVTNIRQASITDELGIVCLEVEGPDREVAAGVRWLEKRGVQVEPVELSAVAP